MRTYKASEQANELLRATASSDPKKAQEAMANFALAYQEEYREALADIADCKAGKAVAQFNEQTPLRRAVFREDLIGNIYTRLVLADGASARFPLDFVAEGEQDDFTAFTMPKQGYIPERHVEGDELWVPTFRVANAIDWDIRYARDARWDVVEGAMDVFRSGFIKRNNDDGWHTILSAAAGTGEMITDAAATSGFFTKELINKMKTRQRRRTLNGMLTDLYVSPEAMEDIRAWADTELDDITRHEIYSGEALNGLEPTIRIFGVQVHDMRELGVGQEYQLFFTSDLSTSLGGGGDEELVIGLDLSKEDSFLMPVRNELEMFDDPNLHRQGRAGVYGWMEHGFAVLDDRRVLPGSF